MSLNKYFLIGAGISLLIAGTSCQDETSEVGSSLVSDESEVIIDSLFTVTGHSEPNSSILSRTTMQLLGSINAQEYGQFTSGFVTQFMPAQNIETSGVSVNDIDSVKLVMFIRPGGFTGDSIVPMGLTVYKLNQQLPSSITSEFDPDGYYDNQPWASAMYSANALHNDSIANLAFRTVSVDLPRSFGQELYTEYVSNPTTFTSPQLFSRFFPGVYVKSTFGSGRVMNIVDTRINLHFTRHETIGSGSSVRDTAYHFVRSYLAVTPEIITDNLIDYNISPQLQARISNGESILVAPAGTEVKMDFPVKDLLASFRSQGQGTAVLNTVSLSVPVETIQNSFGIEPPANVLFVLSKDKDKFFANNKISDDKTSFLASYSKTDGSYNIPDMRNYILSLLDKETITADDYTFTITAVDVVTETSSSGYYYEQSYITGINPYVSIPAMANLRFDKAKIKMTFSKQSVNY